jgi:hypothetical protein
LEEEVAVDAGNADELAVADREDISKGLDRRRGRVDALCLGYEGRLVVAALVSGTSHSGGRYILDLVEETLALDCLVCVFAGILLLYSLVQLPVAAEYQEDGDLSAENDSGRR